MSIYNIEKLADRVFQAESNYRAIGAMNNYGLSQDEKMELNRRYAVAEARVIEARRNLAAEKNIEK